MRIIYDGKKRKTDEKVFLSIVLYNGGVQPDKDGWFSVDEVVGFTSKMTKFDLQTLITIVENDDDQRYIFNEDRTLIRINPKHIAPKSVEEQMKTADNLKIEPSIFELNRLPYKEDKKRKIVVTSDNGGKWQFPYETNKIFYLDKKRFFVLVEIDNLPAFLVCAFLSKDSIYRYRMVLPNFPSVLNYIFSDGCRLSDYEGNNYRVNIETTE